MDTSAKSAPRTCLEVRPCLYICMYICMPSPRADSGSTGSYPLPSLPRGWSSLLLNVHVRAEHVGLHSRRVTGICPWRTRVQTRMRANMHAKLARGSCCWLDLHACGRPSAYSVTCGTAVAIYHNGSTYYTDLLHRSSRAQKCCCKHGKGGRKGVGQEGGPLYICLYDVWSILFSCTPHDNMLREAFTRIG